MVAAAVQERKAARDLVVKSVVKSVVEPLGVVTPSTSIESLGAAAPGAALPVQVCDKVDTQTSRAANGAQMLAPSMPSLSRYKPRWAHCFESENENDNDDVWTTPAHPNIEKFELPRPPEPSENEPVKNTPLKI